MNRSQLFGLLIAGALSCPAATTTLTGVDYNRGMSLNFFKNGDSNGYAGAVNITVSGTVDGTVDTITFCVDLFTSIGLSTYNTTLQSPSTVTNGGRVAWLLQNILPSVDTATEGSSGLQLAIWDIVHDNGDGLAAGLVRQHSAPNVNDLAAYGFASTYITSSLGQSSTAGTVYHNVTFEGAPAQTLMNAETLTPNPEPGTWVMFGCGAALIGLARIRRLGN